MPGPVELCKSTLHDNLQGTRLTLPPWEWVATFVRALRVAVEEDGLDADQLVGTVEEWRQRYVTARQILSRQRNAEPGLPLSAPVPQQAAVAGMAGAAGAAGVAGRTAERAAGDPPHEGTPDPFTLDIGFLSGPLQGTDPCAGMTGWADTASAEVCAAPGELFGDHGVELLHRAGQGDPEAPARLGILLLCRGGDPEQALWWLDDAASRGDVMAQSLRGTDPARRRELAAGYAFELAQPVDGSPDVSPDGPPDGPTDGPAGGAPDGPAGRPATTGVAAAAVYYEAAAEAGHPGAAYRLGVLSEARGEITQALHWYEMAADYGDARERRNRLDRTSGDSWKPPAA